MDEITLKQIYEDLAFVKQKVINIDEELDDLSTDFHELRPEYIKKLKKIGKEKGKVFDNKEAFLDFLKNEV